MVNKQKQGGLDDVDAPEVNDGTVAAEDTAMDSVWVFSDRPATVDEVKALLASVTVPYSGGRVNNPDGLSYSEVSPTTMDKYLPYVLPMVNRQKVKTPDPNNPARDIETSVRQTTLYTQVAGRLAILADVAEQRLWTVDIYPEQNTPTGVPGYLRFDDRLVFRVYVEISMGGKSLGRRFGTAWAKSEGGFSAEGSNPYETVETSALGRALAQWGFGILPGSGIASVEEMRLARTNQAGQRAVGAPPRAEAPPKEERGDLVASAITFLDRLRKIRSMSQADSDLAVGSWVQQKFALEGFVDEFDTYHWERLTDQQITLLRNSMRDAVMAATAAGEAS